MNTTEEPGKSGPVRVPSTREAQEVDSRASRFAGVLIVTIMLALAAGVVALECGFYQAFDDNLLKMDASPASLALALFGASAADAA